MDAAALGVQFAEMVLRVMPGGPEAIVAADGIDALESLQFRCYIACCLAVLLAMLH